MYIYISRDPTHRHTDIIHGTQIYVINHTTLPCRYNHAVMQSLAAGIYIYIESMNQVAVNGR